jgi:hypothetical protein
MNWPDRVLQDAGGMGDATAAAAHATHALYQGDCGQLQIETRRALVQLLLGPALDARRHPRLWPVLIRDEAVLRSRLADLFLELVIDVDQKVAFTRQADVGELEAPILLRRAPLTFVDSVILLLLRQRLTQAEVRGERAVVETIEIMEQLAPYERAANTDHAGFQKRIRASIEKMKDHSILQKIRGSEDRYEISPTLKLLFSAEHIAELTRQYQELTDATGGQIAAEPEGADNEEESNQ